jgi:FMN phosphatase YigB (HAD superfamily)
VDDPGAHRFAAVLLDLDDTLVPWQTVAHWQWAWRPLGPLLSERHTHAAIRRALHQWDRRRWQGLVGKAPRTDPEAYRAFLHDTLTAVAGHPLPEGEASAVVSRFLKPAHEGESYPDALAALKRLDEEKVKVGVIADLPEETARLALRRSGLPDGLLLMADDAPEPRPPTSAGFRAVLRAMGVKPSETLFVGDLFWSDVRAAGRAGLAAALIDRPDQAEKVLATRIRTLTEIPALLRAAVAPPSAPGPEEPPGH